MGLKDVSLDGAALVYVSFLEAVIQTGVGTGKYGGKAPRLSL